ncbi:hypothetical protein E2C01_037567 [Portunus trituberculatus]|uniref:Uncharacterized protein n=1 Tax=Portunus trituberculatus TaxID=210409 RepID=A0A5B7FBS3_PORTR|nr:hypothetical protein [Portunus trituberculatus]
MVAGSYPVTASLGSAARRSKGSAVHELVWLVSSRKYRRVWAAGGSGHSLLSHLAYSGAIYYNYKSTIMNTLSQTYINFD